jgi:hypothetical protein
MYIDHRNPRLRRGFAFVALAAVMGLALVGLTQCRLVNDTVTGVDLNSSATGLNARSDCVRHCNEKYKVCKRAEEALHKANKKSCDLIADSNDRKACKKAEQVRHHDAHKQCVSAKKACKAGCYNEGAGSLGS